MSRTWIGYLPELSHDDLYKQNRGTWVLGARAAREDYATLSFEGRVVAVIEIDHIETVPAKVPGARTYSAIVGRVLRQGDPGYDELIGREVDGYRNPVTYFQDRIDVARLCRCGCGETVPQHRQFLPGHDQRAIHERITRQWGDTVGFIRWYDRTYPAA